MNFVGDLTTESMFKYEGKYQTCCKGEAIICGAVDEP
jgi:hypothetical protein